jgi:hypothetical protein
MQGGRSINIRMSSSLDQKSDLFRCSPIRVNTKLSLSSVVLDSSGSDRHKTVQDPMIYSRLYAPSGFDMIGILVSF